MSTLLLIISSVYDYLQMWIIMPQSHVITVIACGIRNFQRKIAAYLCVYFWHVILFCPLKLRHHKSVFDRLGFLDQIEIRWPPLIIIILKKYYTEFQNCWIRYACFTWYFPCNWCSRKIMDSLWHNISFAFFRFLRWLLYALPDLVVDMKFQ